MNNQNTINNTMNLDTMNMDTIDFELYYPDDYNKNKKRCRKIIISCCYFNLFLLINYISFCLGMIFKDDIIHNNCDCDNGSSFN
jgi:hypothetical protein